MALIKTYRRDEDGVLHCLEAWTDPGSFVIHRGKVGTKGSHVRRAIRDRTFGTSPTFDEHVTAFRERTAVEGYRSRGVMRGVMRGPTRGAGLGCAPNLDPYGGPLTPQ